MGHTGKGYGEMNNNIHNTNKTSGVFDIFLMSCTCALISILFCSMPLFAEEINQGLDSLESIESVALETESEGYESGLGLSGNQANSEDNDKYGRDDKDDSRNSADYGFKVKMIHPIGIGRGAEGRLNELDESNSNRKDNSLIGGTVKGSQGMEPEAGEENESIEEGLLGGKISGYGSIVLPQQEKDGEGNNIPEDVFSVMLPLLTDVDMDFIMDPKGVLRSDPDMNNIYDGSSVYFTHYGTEPLIHSGISRTGMAVNKGTLAVKLHVELSISNGTNIPVTYTGMGEVQSDENMNLAFCIIPTEGNRTGINGEVQEAALLNEGRVETDASGKAYLDIILDSAKENFTVVMKPLKDIKDIEEEKAEEEGEEVETVSEYILPTESVNGAEEGEVTKDNVPIAGNEELKTRAMYVPGVVEAGLEEELTWPAVGFAIGGALNKKADWSQLMNYNGDGKLGINVSYYIEPIEVEGGSGSENVSELEFIEFNSEIHNLGTVKD